MAVPPFPMTGDEAPFRQPGQEHDRRWRPDPPQLTPHHTKAARTEEFADRDRRDDDGPPGEEVARIREWSEECHPEAAVRQGVEHTVRRGRQEEEGPEPCAARTSHEGAANEHG